MIIPRMKFTANHHARSRMVPLPRAPAPGMLRQAFALASPLPLPVLVRGGANLIIAIDFSGRRMLDLWPCPLPLAGLARGFLRLIPSDNATRRGKSALEITAARTRLGFRRSPVTPFGGLV